MSKLEMHWQVRRDDGPQADAAAEFFLYRSGEAVHCDHRQYSRDELERRVGAMRASVGSVPVYYEQAIEALADPGSPPSGRVVLDAD
jgi:hypothetical protein